MKCEKCGFENSDDAEFCVNCGSIFVPDTSAKSKENEVAEEAPKTETAEETLKAEATQETPKIEASEETQKNEEIAKIVNSDEVVTKEMVSAFNEKHKSEKELTAQELDQIKLEYFKSINKNPEVHNEIYDPKLVEIENKGVITDKNIESVLIRKALEHWGIILGAVVVLIILLFLHSAIGYGIIGTFLFILELMACGAIFIMVILQIGEFISFLKSSRDSSFKLKSGIHILPILVLIILSLIFLGLEARVGLIIGFVIIGAIGLICIMVMGK